MFFDHRLCRELVAVGVIMACLNVLVLIPNPADVSFQKGSYGMIHMLMVRG